MWKTAERKSNLLTVDLLKENKQTCFTGAIVSLVSCLRKCFPLKVLKRLGVCLLNRGNTFLDWEYFSTPAVVN